MLRDEINAAPSPDAPPDLAPIFSGVRPRPQTVQEQLEAIAPAQMRSLAVEDLPRLRLLGKGGQYVLESWLHSRRPRTSWITAHGHLLVQVQATGLGETLWLCSTCDKRRKTKIYASAATSSAIRHLQLHHKINEDPDTERSTSSSGKPAVNSQLQRAPITHTAAAQFKSNLLRLIVDGDFAFNVVERPAFRSFLTAVNTTLTTTLLPEDSETIKRWVNDQYEHQLQVIRRDLLSAISKIHVSFDLWTSPATEAYESVVLYYVDDNGSRHTRVVALQRLFGTHSGENQAAVLVQVLQRYGIADAGCLGFFMADNAESCDTTVRAVLASLHPSRSLSERKDLEHLYRCRCVGHILNLAAKAFLKGEDAPIDSLNDPAMDTQVVRQWRKRGPIGKLHNIVRWVRSSSKRKDRFMEFSTGQANRDGPPSESADPGALLDCEEPPPGLVLVSDNDTRWNSTLAMILRALKLRKVMEVFCAYSQQERREEDRVPAEDRLMEDDWQVLVELVAVLQPLYRLTKRFEGNRYVRFGEVLPNLYLLQAEMARLQELYRSDMDRQPARVLDVIFAQPLHAAEDGDAGNEPEAPPPADTYAPDRPRRRTRLPTRLDDYVVEMPSQRHGRGSITLARGPAVPPAEDVQMDNDAPERLSQHSKEVIWGSIQLLRDKITKYEDLLDANIVGWAAMALDPRIKMRWVAKNLSPVRRDLIMTRLRDFYDYHYPCRLRIQPSEDSSGPASPVNTCLPSYNALLDLGDDGEPDAVDELSDYLAQPLDRSVKEDQLLNWWCNWRDRWPRLFCMAMDLLSIPSMSSENERSFSQAKLVMTSQRQRLHHTTLEKLVLLKAWNKDGLFNGG